MGIKREVISGIKWTAVEKYISKTISVITFIILARILEPKVFGLFAMAFVLIDGFNIFRNLGVDGALIQRQNNFQEATHTGFFIFPITGIVVFILLYFSAPFASLWFGEPSLTAIIRTLGFIFLIGSLGNIPQILLTKNMRFKEIAIRDLISNIFFSAIALPLAYLGFGVWSLVYAYIVRIITNLILMWKIVKYKPKLLFNKKIALELLNFGKYLLGSSMVIFCMINLDKAVVGRILGATALGYYALAFSIASITQTHFTGLIGRVMFPAYAKMQNDKSDIKRTYLKILKNISFICIPFGIGLVLLAPKFVNIVYGQKWLPIVPVLRVLAIYSVGLPLFFKMDSIFTACGKPKWSFYLDCLSLSILTITILPFTRLFGLIGVGYSKLLSDLFVFPFSLHLVKRLINLKLKEIFAVVKTPIIGSLFMALVIILLKNIPPVIVIKNLDFSLFIQVAFLGSLIYFLTIILIDRKFIFEAKNLVFNRK